MKTYMAKKEEVKRNWILVDVKDKVLGRAATVIADALRGKNRPTYTPHVDTGDFVIVVNAAQVKLTGDKWEDKLYHHHSGYMGGLKSTPAKKMLEKHADEIITKAVKGMLPRTRLGKQILTKLKVFTGTNHPHKAQSPKEITIN